MLGERPLAWWHGPGCDLDAFYRRALMDGLDLHVTAGRGLLPGDLVEEIRALAHPPIPWDVQLGQWLDVFFPPLERRRSFARLSRRQSTTPDILRPVWINPPERMASRTFGVVLDTSGSMPPRLLARALGAISSYAIAARSRWRGSCKATPARMTWAMSTPRRCSTGSRCMAAAARHCSRGSIACSPRMIFPRMRRSW
jgi:hypothetical protein